MNSYLYNSTDKVLEVTYIEDKTLEDIEYVIGLGKNIMVIDKIIALYLPTIDPAQLIIDEWYSNEQMLANADPKALPTPVINEDGSIGTPIPNLYTQFKALRNKLEYKSKWLRGYRGLVAPTRPKMTETVLSWKAANLGDRLFKRDRVGQVESIRVSVSGVELDGDEISQGRLARAGLGMIAAKLFAIEAVLRNSTTSSAATLRKQLVSALDSPEASISIPWVTSDNLVTSLNSRKAIEALVKAGSAQSLLWSPKFK